MISAARHRSPGPGRAVRSRAPGRRRAALAAGAAAVVAAAGGCTGFTPGNGELTDDINVSSTLLMEGSMLPDAFTCRGEGEAGSPPLQWSGQPEDIGSFAIVADAPGAAEVFWVLFDLDPATVEIRQDGVPQPAHTGENSFGDTGYTPPCPEEDDPHEYRFTVYALDQKLELPQGAPLTDTLEQISAHTVARGSLVTAAE